MLKSSVKTCLLISSSCVKNREKSLCDVATGAKFLNLNKPRDLANMAVFTC